MMFNNRTRNGLFAVTAMTLASLTFASGAQAYQCKNSYTQMETGAKKKWKAQALGRTYWSDKVKSDYGLAWSVWDIAASKSQTCEHTGNQWYCVTKAEPCLYVVP